MTLTRDGESRCLHGHGDDPLTCGRVVLQEIEVEGEVDNEVARCAVNVGSTSAQNHRSGPRGEKYPVLTVEELSLSSSKVEGPLSYCR